MYNPRGDMRPKPQSFGIRKGILHTCSVVPGSRFLGDTGVPLPEFQGDIYEFWGTDQIFQIILPAKLNSYPEISVHFLFKFELDVDRFGSRRGVDDSEVVSAGALVLNSPANLLFLSLNSFFLVFCYEI